MWRSLRRTISLFKILSHTKRVERHYTNESSSSAKAPKIIFTIVAAAGVGFAGAIAYGQYDNKFRQRFEKTIPYVDFIYKYLPNNEQKSGLSSKSTDDKERIAPSLLKKKLDREKIEKKVSPQMSQVKGEESKPVSKESNNEKSRDHKIIENTYLSITETKPLEQFITLSENQDLEHAFNENELSDMLKKLQSNSDEAIIAYKAAAKAVKRHTTSLFEALDLPEGSNNDILWKEANHANVDKNNALKLAKEKAANTKMVAEKLTVSLQRTEQSGYPKHPMIKFVEESVSKILKQLESAEAEINSAENEAKTATDYQKLVNASKEQFQKELQIVLPNYIHGVKDKTVTESDLNLLIAHAHRRIEQLQKQLAKQQITEKIRVDEAVRQQKLKDEHLTESKIEAEVGKINIDIENAISNRVSHLKENFETELRQQLRRQAAAHADHLAEVLKIQEQELARKHSLDLEEKLLHQKGVFISEISGNIARLKGILAYLKAKSEFDQAGKKAQTLWLACQSMSEKISVDNFDSRGSPYPLSKDIAAVKIAADEDNEFVISLIGGIPSKAVHRGVFTKESLRQRFLNVKKVCRKVALIDEKNDSLYRYFLSHLQSYLTADAVSIPKAELEGKVAVDPSEWDTYDLLSRISYALKVDDLEQALRYANQLKGEPREVAKDWVKELRLLLETDLAVKALIAHAAAIGVQAYH